MGLGRDIIRKLMLKQAKGSPNVGKHMAPDELDGLIRNISATLDDVNLPGKGKKRRRKLGVQEQAEMDAYGEVVGGGLPGTMPPKGQAGIPSIMNVVDDGYDALPLPGDKPNFPPTPPPVKKSEFDKAQRRGWKQGFRTTAYMGSGKAWDPTIERGNGSKIRWFADKPDPAHSYMEGKQQATSSWARNDPSPIEDNANMAPVKLKLGKTLVVNGNGRVWDQLSPKGIKDKAAREALEPYAYNGRLSTDEIARKAQEMGFDSVTFRDIKDYMEGNANVPAHNVYAMINAKNIRGKYAKFENKNRGKLADLLAGSAAAAGVGAALANKDDQT